MNTDSPDTRARIRQLRGAVILFAIVANLVYALPFPNMKKADLEDPDWYRSEMKELTAVLQQVGVSRTVDEVQEVTRLAAWQLRQLVLAVRAPLSPWFRATATNQQWGLFAAITEQPDRLVIEVDRGDGWQRYYARLDPEHHWRDPLFRYRRVRGIWDSVRDTAPKGTYLRLAQWTAREIMREEPSVERVKFGLHRFNLSLPWEPIDPEITKRAERIYRRDRLFERERP